MKHPKAAVHPCALIPILFFLWVSPTFSQERTAETLESDNRQPGRVDDEKPQRRNIHFQATSIAQHHGSFYSEYEGQNSLPHHPENRISWTATAFTILRMSHNFGAVISLEVAGGKGFGDVTGIAVFTNGEIPRVAQATPQLYLARGYVRGI
jgi:high affinity Mn2+ porin